MMKNYRYLFLSVFVIVLDQISKYMIRRTMEDGSSVSVMGKFFLITHVQNTGAAFSLSFGSPSFNRILFAIITLLAVGFVLYLLRQSHSKWQNVSFVLIIGGALGNLIDRIIRGSVTDFLDFDFPDFIMYRWPVFNVADSSIFIGMVLLAVYIFFLDEKNTSLKPEEALYDKK